jgi:hypothetical protein
LTHGVVRSGLHAHAGINPPPVSENVGDGVAELPEQMHAADDELQVKFAVRSDGPHRGDEQPVLGAGAGDDGDTSLPSVQGVTLWGHSAISQFSEAPSAV